MRVLFVGETWKGSSDRSFKEELSRLPGMELEEIGHDRFEIQGRSLVLRIANRMLRPSRAAELRREIDRTLLHFKPHILLVAKGTLVEPTTIRDARQSGILTVNRFSDCSPHAHGRRLKTAIGLYDLVISTKPYHPPNWLGIYGYTNQCVCVPHGYSEGDFRQFPSSNHDVDVVLVASWRRQYENLLVALASALDTSGMRFLVAGPGWERNRHKLPSHWEFPGAIHGLAYVDVLRRGKIVIAPVHTEMVVGHHVQPGDQDTTRTYELAAAHCFFLHRRTPYVQGVYSEVDEVPMWDDAAELGELIRKFLPLPEMRQRMAAAAHKRAVPAYSIAARAAQAWQIIEQASGTPVRSTAL